MNRYYPVDYSHQFQLLLDERILAKKEKEKEKEIKLKNKKGIKDEKQSK